MFRSLTDLYERIVLLKDQRHVVFASAASRRVLVKTVMEVVVSLSLLVVSIPCVVSRDIDPESKKYFSGLIGTVVGYWLK